MGARDQRANDLQSPPEPTPKILQIPRRLHRTLSTVIIQIRTETIRPRQFLFRRNAPDIADDKCDCERGNRTVKHVLTACPRHINLRREIWKDESKWRREVWDLKQILNTPTLAVKAATFIVLTRLHGQFEAVSKNDIL